MDVIDEPVIKKVLGDTSRKQIEQNAMADLESTFECEPPYRHYLFKQTSLNKDCYDNIHPQGNRVASVKAQESLANQVNAILVLLAEMGKGSMLTPENFEVLMKKGLNTAAILHVVQAFHDAGKKDVLQSNLFHTILGLNAAYNAHLTLIINALSKNSYAHFITSKNIEAIVAQPQNMSGITSLITCLANAGRSDLLTQDNIDHFLSNAQNARPIGRMLSLLNNLDRLGEVNQLTFQQLVDVGSRLGPTFDVLKDMSDVRNEIPDLEEINKLLSLQIDLDQWASTHNMLRQYAPKLVSLPNAYLLASLSLEQLNTVYSALWFIGTHEDQVEITQEIFSKLCDSGTLLSSIISRLLDEEITQQSYEVCVFNTEILTKLCEKNRQECFIINQVLRECQEHGIGLEQVLPRALINPQETLEWVGTQILSYSENIELRLKDLVQDIGSDSPDALVKMLRHYRCQEIEHCSAINILQEEVSNIVNILSEHPEFLSFAKKIAQDALHGHCVEQPIQGVIQLQAWLYVASQKSFVNRFAALRQLYAIEKIKLEVRDNRSISPQAEAHAMNTILSQTYQILRQRSSEQLIWPLLSDMRLTQNIDSSQYQLIAQKAALKTVFVTDAEIEKFVFEQRDRCLIWGQINSPQVIIKLQTLYERKMRFFNYLREYKETSSMGEISFSDYLAQEGLVQDEVKMTYLKMYRDNLGKSVAQIEQAYQVLADEKDNMIHDDIKEATKAQLKSLCPKKSTIILSTQSRDDDYLVGSSYLSPFNKHFP